MPTRTVNAETLTVKLAISVVLADDTGTRAGVGAHVASSNRAVARAFQDRRADAPRSQTKLEAKVEATVSRVDEDGIATIRM